jgi:hypothetical protein
MVPAASGGDTAFGIQMYAADVDYVLMLKVRRKHYQASTQAHISHTKTWHSPIDTRVDSALIGTQEGLNVDLGST